MLVMVVVVLFVCARVWCVCVAISRQRYKIDAWFLLKLNRKSYAVYRMVTLRMTLSDP